MSLARYLIELRKQRGWSLRDAAQATGLSHAYLGNLEKGIAPASGRELSPTLATIRRLAEGYGVDPANLLIAAGLLRETPSGTSSRGHDPRDAAPPSFHLSPTLHAVPLLKTGPQPRPEPARIPHRVLLPPELFCDFLLELADDRLAGDGLPQGTRMLCRSVAPDAVASLEAGTPLVAYAQGELLSGRLAGEDDAGDRRLVAGAEAIPIGPASGDAQVIGLVIGVYCPHPQPPAKDAPYPAAPSPQSASLRLRQPQDRA